jgi:PAS domain S-box-containing protein
LILDRLAMKSELAEQITKLEPGGHLCLFYEKDPAEQMPALVPFIQEALARDEQFIYIADDQTVDDLAVRLELNGINVTRESQRRRLNLWTRQQWRQPGDLDSSRKGQQVLEFISAAANAGFKGIRFAVEMTWTLGPDISPQQLEYWEATINTLFEPAFPGRIICQYNRSRLSPELMVAALHTHPLAILGNHVYPNLFYQAPLILDSNGNGNGHTAGNGNGKAAAAKLEWMISQLQRARAAEIDREEMIAQRAALAEAQRARQQIEVEISERKRAEEASRRLAAIVQSSDDAIISKDLEGTITSWNKGAELIFGYTVEEALGQPIVLLIPPERRDEEFDILRRLRQGERIEHYETVRQRKDGSLVEISLTISPLRNDQGQIIGASKIARDITESKRAERALQAARLQLATSNQELEKRVQERTASLREAIGQLEEFSYSVSHDLRAPVRAMQGYAKTIEEDYAGQLDPRGRDFVQRIIRASSRMDRLILDVLTYTRLARCEIQLQPVSLDKLAREIIQQYPEMQSPRAEIIFRGQLLPVVAHEPSLTQAISNLLSNAVKFVAPGTIPEVRLWTEPRGDKVRLWLEDNGIGIKPEHQLRLFGMFERIHPDNRYDGTGIGLAIVRKALDRMAGKAGLESDGVSGSSFWLELPAVPQ